MQIRTASPSDYAGIEKLVLESFEPITWARPLQEKFGLLNGLDWQARWKSRLKKILSEQHILVGLVDGALVAMSSSTIDPEAGLCYIDLLAVAPGRQGHGYGREMLRATIRQGQEFGAHHVHLNCMVSNKNGNELYESEGFEEVAREIRWFRKI